MKQQKQTKKRNKERKFSALFIVSYHNYNKIKNLLYNKLLKLCKERKGGNEYFYSIKEKIFI